MNTNDKINIFKFLKIHRKETISSQFIVSILNIRDEVTNKKQYLELFLKEIKCSDYVSSCEWSVRAEKPLNSKDKKDLKYGRADIFIESKSEHDRKRIIIENKIDAADQFNQLVNYRSYLNERGSGKLYYLNLLGEPASPSSTKGSSNMEIKYRNPDLGYEVITYNDHILKWLEKVKKETSNELLKLYIDQYFDVIKPMAEVYDQLNRGKQISEFVSKQKKMEARYLLELNFWMRLQELIQQDTNFDKIDTRRRYSLQKISKNKVERAYGLISGHYRIQIDVKTKGLIIGIGKFKNENNWEWEHEIHKIKLAINVKRLNSLTNAEEEAKKVFDRIKKIQSLN